MWIWWWLVRSEVERVAILRGQWNEYLDGYFGSPIEPVPIDPVTVELFRNRLPGALLDAWSQYGFAGFGQGRIWLVNPENYRDVVADWIKGTAVEGLDTYHVIARGAFGDLVVWAERTCDTFRLRIPLGLFAATVDSLRGSQATELQQEQKWQSFLRSFGLRRGRNPLDCLDATDQGLFDACFALHGQLEHNQVFGFAPYLFAGGQALTNNTAIVDEFAQLAVITEFIDKPLFKDISTFPG